jgi:CDP-glucose 4,6-dehydratase
VEVTSVDAFSGRRVLITGHTGFKGSWLSIWLHSLGAKVAGFALAPPSTPNMFDAAKVAACVTDHRGDIRDSAAIRKVVKHFDPEIVFHLAAQSIVRESYRNPVETYWINVVGTAALLDACRFAPSLRAVVVVTSDKCYENKDWVWGYRENDRLGGFDPYSSSKACAELVTDAFRYSYWQGGASDVGVATARAGNVIGGGDWASDRLVPDLARAAESGLPAMIRNPTAIRPWQHVLEPLAGYLSLARHLVMDARGHSGSWNFGPSADSFQSVEVVAGNLAKYWAGRLQWSVDETAHPHEAARLLLDSSKAARALHWRPHLSLDEAVRFTADWYDAHAKNRDMRRVTESQIADYVRATKC